MKRKIVIILALYVFWIPGIICGEDTLFGESLLPTPTYTKPQDTTLSSPNEWYIIEKIPVAKGLAIGIFLFQQGMPIEQIQSKFGKPEEIITLDLEEAYYGTILVYPRHHFFFSKTGHLQTIKERKLQAESTVNRVSIKPKN